MDETNKTVFVNTEIENEAAETADLDKLYWELGKAYYEGAFEDPLPQLLPIFDKITTLVKKQQADANSIAEDINSNPIPFPQTCRGCGTAIPDNARFCPVCGMPTIEQNASPAGSKICSKCGEELGEDAVFCGNCGAPV
ncbi:MAG: zinc ribbon domain-containing protein [Firmicutes bacterium]|nr:zinc ribbon domain-containing protein [Bacillota bacterium]